MNQGLTSIGNGAFSFSDIRSIVIPDSVTYIGEEAFTWCQSLMFVTLGNGITSIEKGTFSLCQSLASIIIPDGVEVIGDEAFDWCGTLTSVTIPASVTSISETAFLSTPALSHIQVSSDNEFYKSVNGSLYSKDGKTLVKYATGKTASGFTIPEGVEVIGAYAFTDCYNLTSVTLPDSVKEICHDAFSGCSGLEIINIPDGVTSIGDYAFVGCDNLTSIIIPESVTSIGRGVFIRCSSLSNVVIGKGVAFIDNYAFCECENLTEISYCGTEEEFDAIEKELFWKHELTKVVYNYSTEE